VQLLLEPWIVESVTDDTGRFDTAVAFLWDSLIGAVVGLPVFWYFGVDPLPALAGAAALGAGYGYLAGWILCGGAVELLVDSVTGEIGRPRASDHSHIEAMEARGDYEAAVDAYEQLLDGRPGQVKLAARLARVLSRRLEKHERAARALRRAAQDGKAPPSQWAYALRILMEILTVKLSAEASGLPNLARLADAHPDDPAGYWARDRKHAIKAKLAAEAAAVPIERLEPDALDD